MDPGLSLPIHFHIGSDRHIGLSSRVLIRNGITNRRQPGFRFPGRFRIQISFIGREINISITLKIGIRTDCQLRLTGNFCQRIPATGNRNHCYTQNITMRGDIDLAGLSLCVTATPDGNISLGRLRRPIKSRRQMIVVRHIIRRAGRADDRTCRIHDGLA